MARDTITTDIGAARKASKHKSAVMAFLGEFVLSPMTIGALTESPPRVAAAMCDKIGLESARAVVEIGPGSGPITREILRRLPAGARFFAIEKNPKMASMFRARNPGVVVHEASGERIRELCVREGMGPLDAVVSSIPWILLPRPVQERMLDEVIASIKPGGHMSFLTYRQESLGIVRRFVALAKDRFAYVEGPQSVRARFATCRVYRCTVRS